MKNITLKCQISSFFQNVRPRVTHAAMCDRAPGSDRIALLYPVRIMVKAKVTFLENGLGCYGFVGWVSLPFSRRGSLWSLACSVCPPRNLHLTTRASARPLADHDHQRRYAHSHTNTHTHTVVVAVVTFLTYNWAMDVAAMVFVALFLRFYSTPAAQILCARRVEMQQLLQQCVLHFFAILLPLVFRRLYPCPPPPGVVHHYRVRKIRPRVASRLRERTHGFLYK